MHRAAFQGNLRTGQQVGEIDALVRVVGTGGRGRNGLETIKAERVLFM
jgi:hypothetical protein